MIKKNWESIKACARTMEGFSKFIASLAIIFAAIFGWSQFAFGWSQFAEEGRQIKIDRSIQFNDRYASGDMKEDRKNAQEFVEKFSSITGENYDSTVAQGHLAVAAVVEFFDDAYRCVEFESCDRNTMTALLSDEAYSFWNNTGRKYVEMNQALFRFIYGISGDGSMVPVGWEGLHCVKEKFVCTNYKGS